MNGIGQTDLSRISVEELKSMRDAGECVRECYRVLKRTNDTIVSEYLKRRGANAPVIDPKSNAQYSFCRSPFEQEPQENGHFHTFIRPRKIPRVGLSVPIAPGGAPTSTNPDFCHIVAIAMDRSGFPVRLFAPNNWVTGSAWLKANDVRHHLAYFTIDHAEPSYPVNVWITNMLVLFRPQIVGLLESRDRLIANRRQQHPEDDVLEDRMLPVTAEQTIDVVRQFDAVRKELLRRTGAGGRSMRILEPVQSEAATNSAAVEHSTHSQERAVEMALQAQIQTLHNAVISAKTTAHALEDQLDGVRKQAWQQEQEHTRKARALRQQYNADLVRKVSEAMTLLEDDSRKKLAAARDEWEKAASARLAAVREETVKTAAAARRSAIDELRSQWLIESNETLSRALGVRTAAEARRLNLAKDEWDAERRRALAERDRVWQVAFDHRVEEKLSEWRRNEDRRLSQAKMEWIAERRYRDVRRRNIVRWARRIALATLIAGLIAGGAALYPIVQPVLAGVWEDNIVANWKALTATIGGAIRNNDYKGLEEPDDDGSATFNAVADSSRQTYVNVSAANLRERPSQRASVVGVLLLGTEVTPLEWRGQWVLVRAPGLTGNIGWVHASLLQARPPKSR